MKEKAQIAQMECNKKIEQLEDDNLSLGGSVDQLKDEVAELKKRGTAKYADGIAAGFLSNIEYCTL